MGRYSTSLWGRINRHLSKQKKNFWHIDYLLNTNHINILDIFWICSETSKECELNQKIQNCNVIIPVIGFGSSDCKAGCKSHLSYSNSYVELIKCIRDIIKNYKEFAHFRLSRAYNTN